MPAELKIYGPYKRGDGFRCLIGEGQTRTTLPIAKTERQALAYAEHMLRRLQAETPPTVAETIERYHDHLKAKGLRPASVTTTLYRLRRFFPHPDKPLTVLTPSRCASYYSALTTSQKADTHRNTLAEVKTFGRWLAEQKMVRVSPFEDIKPTGRRSRGKEQLTRDEAKRWLDLAIEEAQKGNDAALVAAMVLLMGVRPGEVIVRTVRDVDSGGTRLRVRQAKTRAGDRDPKIPEVLQPLLAVRCEGKQPTDLLFPASRGHGEQKRHTVSWVRKQVAKLCQAARVPYVTTYSFRGLHADLGVEQNVVSDVVAKSLGHESSRTTMAHYAKPGTLREVQADRAAQALGIAPAAPHLRLVS